MMKQDQFEKIRTEARRRIAARGTVTESAEENPKMVVFGTVDDLMKSSRKGS